jgi:hypothetical protein
VHRWLGVPPAVEVGQTGRLACEAAGGGVWAGMLSQLAVHVSRWCCAASVDRQQCEQLVWWDRLQGVAGFLSAVMVVVGAPPQAACHA